MIVTRSLGHYLTSDSALFVGVHGVVGASVVTYFPVTFKFRVLLPLAN
jgi:hypothetical protein